MPFLIAQSVYLSFSGPGFNPIMFEKSLRRQWLDIRVTCKGYFNCQNRPDKLKRPLIINYETKLTQPYHRTELCLKNPRPKAWNCSILVCYELFLGNFIYFELWISFRTFFLWTFSFRTFFTAPLFWRSAQRRIFFWWIHFCSRKKNCIKLPPRSKKIVSLHFSSIFQTFADCLTSAESRKSTDLLHWCQVD